MGLQRLFIMYCLVLIVVALNIIEAATAATIFEVGGSLGWTVPSNTSYYATWASSKTFAVGDTLEFKWNSTTSNVLEVMTKAEYDGCTKSNGILRETSPVVTNLSTAGTSYFICSFDTHCVNGQKLAVTSVGSTNTPTTPPESSALPTSSVVLPAILSTIAISFLIIFFI